MCRMVTVRKQLPMPTLQIKFRSKYLTDTSKIPNRRSKIQRLHIDNNILTQGADEALYQPPSRKGVGAYDNMV